MTDQFTRRQSYLALRTVGVAGVLNPRSRGSEPLPFRLGIITDEISQDLDEALAFMSSYSLSHCELRTIDGENIINMSQPELECGKQIIDKHQFQVSDIASPIYRWNLPEMPALPSEKQDSFRTQYTEQDAKDLLKKSFQIARLFGTTKVRIFSYLHVEDPQKAYPHTFRRLLLI